LANYMNSENMTLSSASRQYLRSTEKRERSNGQKVSNLKDDVQEINA
jgi:macrodomain Ter protein organizer (MatP/YcbG family)